MIALERYALDNSWAIVSSTAKGVTVIIRMRIMRTPFGVLTATWTHLLV